MAKSIALDPAFTPRRPLGRVVLIEERQRALMLWSTGLSTWIERWTRMLVTPHAIAQAGDRELAGLMHLITFSDVKIPRA